MLILVTDVPGSGKTLYTVKLLLDQIKLKNDAIKRLPKLKQEGDQKKIDECKALIRDFYVDIDGFDHDKLGTKPAPPDWRDTPDGSVVVYDECQKEFGPDGSGRSKDDRISALETHRHSGHDIYFITQRERLIHSHIRDLVGRHHHVQRQYGSHIAKIFTREETINTKSKSELNACDETIWTYDKKLFGCYKSATVHTHKFKLPTKLKALGGGMVVAIAGCSFLFYQSLDFFSGKSGLDHVQVADADSANMITVSKRPAPLLTGCVVWSNRTECRCHTVDGDVADLEFGQCIVHAEGSNLNFHSMRKRDGVGTAGGTKAEPRRSGERDA